MAIELLVSGRGGLPSGDGGFSVRRGGGTPLSFLKSFPLRLPTARDVYLKGWLKNSKKKASGKVQKLIRKLHPSLGGEKNFSVSFQKNKEGGGSSAKEKNVECSVPNTWSPFFWGEGFLPFGKKSRFLPKRTGGGS